MAHAKDLLGRRFGKLTVLERLPEKHKSRKAIWKCRCDCGNEISVLTDRLMNGTTKSCGCLRKEKGNILQDYDEKYLKKDDVFTPLLKSKLRSDNSTGVKGVYAVKRKNAIKYQARIGLKNKMIYLGVFDTIEEAAKARKRGEEKYFKPFLEDNN